MESPIRLAASTLPVTVKIFSITEVTKAPDCWPSTKNIKIQTKGRHDPCVGIRAVPVGEAMLLFTLADLYLAHKAQIGPIN